MIALVLTERLLVVARLRPYRGIFLFVILNGVIGTQSFFSIYTYTMILPDTLPMASPLAALTRHTSFTYL